MDANLGLALSKRVEKLKPSPTLMLTARARALAAQGIDVVAFTAGEPDFDTPEHVKEAARKALADGMTKYTPTGGIPELKKAIVQKFERDQGLKYAPEQVLVSCGAKHSLFNLFQAFLNPGDEVVILAPFWVSYPEMVELAGGKPVIVQTTAADGYAPSLAALRQALSPRTRAIVINSPSNPTGAVLSKAQLETLGEALSEHDCLIVSDEIYEKLVFDGREFRSLAGMFPNLLSRTVLVNGCSKAYAMTGWRIGYAAGPARLIAAMQNIQDQSTSNANSIAQYAAVAALTGPTASLERMVEEFDRRRRRLIAMLGALDGVSCATPYGAFYAFPNIRGLFGRSYRGTALGSSTQVAEILLQDFRVAVVPGAPFGTDECIRLSFATSLDNIEKGVERLADFVRALD